jgi:5-oxoprolinase (ATP-hydrolysing)/N-methylhydantoinase A
MKRLPMKIVVQGDEITIDLSGAPPEAPRGGTNCTLNYTTAHTVYPFKCLLTPGVRGNAGCYRPFQMLVPEGTILNCRKPASVRIRQTTGWYLGPNIFAALTPAIPDRVRAFSGLPGTSPFYGINAAGRRFIDYLFAGGGQGGSASSDGKSGLLYPIGSSNTSVELFEIRTELLVVEKQLAGDSGGPGRQRGGLGQTIRVVKLSGQERPTQCGLHLPGIGVEVSSMLGGRPGAAAQALATVGSGAGGPEVIEATRLLTLSGPGDTVMVKTAGGHGFGDPLDRPLGLVASDVIHGYVSRAHAETAYGCVFDASGNLDEARSTRNRLALRLGAELARRAAPDPSTTTTSMETRQAGPL